jgi:hypothetical protein
MKCLYVYRNIYIIEIIISLATILEQICNLRGEYIFILVTSICFQYNLYCHCNMLNKILLTF